MNRKEHAQRIASSARHIHVSFPRRPVIFLDIHVRRCERPTDASHPVRARLDPTPG